MTNICITSKFNDFKNTFVSVLDDPQYKIYRCSLPDNILEDICTGDILEVGVDIDQQKSDDYVSLGWAEEIIE